MTGSCAIELWQTVAMTEANQPTLRGSRVCLRMAKPEDVPDLFALHSNNEVMRYWSCAPYTSMAQAQELFDRSDRGVRAGEFHYWALTRTDDDRLIGHCTLFNISATHRRAETGYALARRHWGHGYACEAMSLVLDYAFGPLGLHRVEADVDPRNGGSIRLLERLGFVREGLLRERWRVNDEVTDSAMFGLLAPDYATATRLAVASGASRPMATRDSSPTT